jgi:hypothetical protein
VFPGQRCKTTAALALSSALLTVPAAAAGTKRKPTRPAPAAATIVRVTVPHPGFDWTDAGIGAAGGFAISMVGVGAALIVSGHRPRGGTRRHARE